MGYCPLVKDESAAKLNGHASGFHLRIESKVIKTPRTNSKIDGTTGGTLLNSFHIFEWSHLRISYTNSKD